MHRLTSATGKSIHGVIPSRETPSNAPTSVMVSSMPFTASTMQLELPTIDPCPPRPTDSRDTQWFSEYGHKDTIFEKTIDLQGTLNYSKINPLTRAQMLDWMIEVLTNLSRRFSEATFFKSVQLMDMFFKTSGHFLTDNQVHLVGITCMYIGSKYEDIEPLRIQELIRDAAYNKFNCQQLREKEIEVLTAVKFQTAFKTHVEVLDYFYFRVYSRYLSKQSQDLRSLARNFCIMAIADVGFHDYDIRYVVLACMANAGLYMTNLANAGRPVQYPHCLQSTVKQSQSPTEGQSVFGLPEIARRVKSYVQKECVRGNFPREIWQLVEYMRVYLKQFPVGYAVCRQMCGLLSFDPALLNKE